MIFFPRAKQLSAKSWSGEGVMRELHRVTLSFIRQRCSSAPNTGEQGRRTEKPSEKFWPFTRCAAGFQSPRLGCTAVGDFPRSRSREQREFPRNLESGCKWQSGYQTLASAQILSFAKGKHFKSVLQSIVSQWWTNLIKAARKLRPKYRLGWFSFHH